MIKNVLFVFDDSEERIHQKINKVKSIVGDNNVMIHDDYSILEITIRCNSKQWKQIKFHLDLFKYYC